MEKFSSNLNALISSNQLQVTTLQIPTNAPIGRRGSVIADYMQLGEKSDVGDSDEEEEEICYEFGGDDVEEIKQEYARRKQLFFDVRLRIKFFFVNVEPPPR